MEIIRKLEYFWLFLILAVAFSLRLYQIDSPVADWHSWRQADTSSVSRNFLKFSFDLLHPRFDDLSNVPSGKDNPQGYRFVEFPIYNAISASVTNAAGRFPLERWERLISILASLGSIIFLYLMVKKYLGRRVGLLSAVFFAVLPFNIYFSRTILPEPTLVFFSLGMIYFFDQWLEENSKFKIQNSKLQVKIKNYLSFVLAVIFGAMALLIKPYVLFLFLPMFYLVWRRWGIKFILKPSLYLYILLSLAPLIWWRQWMSQFPEGIPASDWLFNEAGIRFKGAFFYWIFADRIGRLILGYFGVAFLILGLLVKRGNKESWFFDWWLISILIYFAVLAGGNVRHDYYQVIAIPILCIFLAKGASYLLNVPREYFNRTMGYLLFITCLIFMFAFSWYHVRDFFNINHPEIIEAGKAVDRLIPKEAKVIAPYGGDTAFLYQTNRQGWPVGFEIEEKIKKGANFYVNVNFDPETDYVMKKYEILEKTDRYVIVKLQRP